MKEGEKKRNRSPILHPKIPEKLEIKHYQAESSSALKEKHNLLKYI